MDNLPHELIIAILLWLPVKSLIRFKCVCKSWFSLISDPHFSISHFQLPVATHTSRIMCLSKSRTEYCSIDFEAFLNYDPHPASPNINFWFPQTETDFPVKIKGSCRGFLLLYRRPDIIYIWNPSTGFKKQIPLSPFDSKLATFSNDFDHLYGFGYDQARDDYLVVVLSHDITEAADVLSSNLEFFSVRDNRWTEIDGTHFPYFGDREGLLFNGAIHWLAFRPDLEIYVIVAFDLMERKLFEMPLPDDFRQELNMPSGLWVFGEFLGLWAKRYDDTVEIWVMKEYTLNSSWTKTFVLPRNSIPKFYFSPICSTNNGDIIGTMCGLVKLNDKGQLLRHRSFLNSLSDIVMYTESLLSLPGGQ